ncbi:MAG: ABC transporter permease [Acidobacteria bacterium]|nr:ABC transporter permease [Acidobacteriota bacterium]
MFGALALVTFRQWRQHKLRLGLTLLGIALGVAVSFAVRTANTTLMDSLHQTVEKLAGKATLQITAGEAGFPQEILQTVRQTPGVKIAEPLIETIAQTTSGVHLLLLGVDTSSDLKLHSDLVKEEDIAVSNPLAFIKHADSIIVSRPYAEQYNLKEGDPLELYTVKGKQTFRVRGFFQPVGAGDIFGGNLAVLDIEAAQEMFGKDANYDRIDLMTDANITVEAVQESLRAKLPKGLEVERPSGRGKSLENASRSVQLGFVITSFLALLIGVFIIFNSFTISINQRWKEIGVLRALGVNRQQTQWMFLGEAIVLGVIGSALGIALGYSLAIYATRIMSGISISIYGLLTTAKQPQFHFDYAATAFGVGVVASLFSAWLPARAVTRLNPILALQNIETRQPESVIGLPRLALGIGLILLGLALTQFPSVQVGVHIQMLYSAFAQLGLLLLLPKFIAWGAKLLRPVMDTLFRAEGMIAVDSMARAPRRTSATVGALMIGGSFVFSNGAFIQSQKAAVFRSLDRAINTDYLIKATEQVRSRVYHFSAATAQQIAMLPGIKQTENLRLTSTMYQGNEVSLIAHEIDVWLRRATDVLDEGNLEQARVLGAKGEGLIVSQNFAARFGLRLGTMVKLETPSGELARPILGIVEYYTSENGTIFLDRALYKQYWHDDAVDEILVMLTPDANRATFKSDVERLIAGQQQAFIYTQEEYRAWVTRIIDQFFLLLYLQMLVAIFVAALGLINTMVISVAERRQELGVLRVIGSFRWQISKMIMLEAVAISLLGLATGIVSGLINAYFLVHTAAKVIAGFTLPFRFPIVMVVIAAPIVIIVALLSAWVPARHAARLRVVEAIRQS